MSSTTTFLLRGMAPPLVILLNARWQQGWWATQFVQRALWFVGLASSLLHWKRHEIQLHYGRGIVTGAIKIEKPNLLPCVHLQGSSSAGTARLGLLHMQVTGLTRLRIELLKLPHRKPAFYRFGHRVWSQNKAKQFNFPSNNFNSFYRFKESLTSHTIKEGYERNWPLMTISYTPRWKFKLGEVMAWGIETSDIYIRRLTLKKARHYNHYGTEKNRKVCLINNTSRVHSFS